MRIVFTLLEKDWMRIIRNPVAWIILFVLPLLVTFIMGAAFGGRSGEKAPTLRLLIVDEDQSFIGNLLEQIVNSDNSGSRVEIDFLDKEVGYETFLKNKHNAMLIIPDGYSESLISGERLDRVRLIKNPTQSILPHVAEDLILTGIQVVDILRSPIKNELREIVKDFRQKDRIDILTASRFLLSAEDKLKAYEKIFLEPLISLNAGYSLFDKASKNREDSKVGLVGAESETDGSSIFAIVLPMMTSFFLFFGAESSARDLFREADTKNLYRYMARSTSMMPLVLSKVIFSFCFISLSTLFLYGSAALIFGIHWVSPLTISLLSCSYSILVSGVGFFFVAVCGYENRTQLWSNFFIFFMAFAGGSIFSAHTLPGFLLNYVTPFLPNFWYVSAIHSTQGIGSEYSVFQAVVQLLVTGVSLIWFSAVIIQRRITHYKFAQ